MGESVSLREQLFQLFFLMNDHVVSCVKKLTGLIGSTGSFAIISLLVSSPIALSLLQRRAFVRLENHLLWSCYHEGIQ